MAIKELCRVLPGILRGIGLDSTCSVEFEDVAVRENSTAYSQLCITWVEKQLPDGTYVLLFRGQLLGVRLSGGRWIMPVPFRQMVVAGCPSN